MAGATYDFRDRLVQATDGGGAVHTYTYDALGRRVQQVDTTSGTTVSYHYFGDRVIEEQDGNGAARITYVLGVEPTPFLLHEEQDLDGNQLLEPRWYHVDASSNVLALTGPSGLPVERYDYDDHGRVTITDGQGAPRQSPSSGNLYLFGGMRYDVDTGLFWIGPYLYDPATGRYLMRVGSPADTSGSTATRNGGNPWTP